MAMRIVDPTPRGAVGVGVVGGGALTTMLAGFRGPAALLGVAVLSAGIALLDGVDGRRIGWRQLAIVLLALGAFAAAWGLVVTALLAMVGLPVGAVPLGLLGGGAAAVVAGVVLMGIDSRSRSLASVAARRRTASERRRPPSPAELDPLAG